MKRDLRVKKKRISGNNNFILGMRLISRECESEIACASERISWFLFYARDVHTAGPQGVKGELGPTGPPGLTGDKGTRGKQGKRVSFSEVLRRTTTDQINRINHFILITAIRIFQLSPEIRKENISPNLLLYLVHLLSLLRSMSENRLQRSSPSLKLLCYM